jgi:hypothetical protein
MPIGHFILPIAYSLADAEYRVIAYT